MKFVQDKSPGYRIHAYDKGEITLMIPPELADTVPDENPTVTLKRFSQNLVLTSHHLLENWHVGGLEQLQAEHLDAVLSLQPEMVILGTGTQQRFPATELLQRFYQQNIGIEVMDTAAACRTFNILVAENRHIAAALLLN